MRYFLVITLLAAYCDPLGPSASGGVNIAPGIDVTPFARLVVEIVPADGSSADANAIDDEPVPMTWPAEVSVGGRIDARPVAKSYEVDAWLAVAQGTTAPPERLAFRGHDCCVLYRYWSVPHTGTLIPRLTWPTERTTYPK